VKKSPGLRVPVSMPVYATGVMKAQKGTRQRAQRHHTAICSALRSIRHHHHSHTHHTHNSAPTNFLHHYLGSLLGKGVEGAESHEAGGGGRQRRNRRRVGGGGIAEEAAGQADQFFCGFETGNERAKKRGERESVRGLVSRLVENEKRHSVGGWHSLEGGEP
jgi:hypothetical protein